MASNRSPIRPSLSQNTPSTPNNTADSPSDVRCVTQTQDSQSLFETPDSAPGHQHILNSICDAEQVDNDARWDTPQGTIVPTPVIPSPNRAAIQKHVVVDLFKKIPKGKRVKDTARKSGTHKAMKKRAHINPSSNLLWFLRNKFVDGYAEESTTKALSTAQRYKPAYDFWSKKTKDEKKRNALFPFDDLRESLNDGMPLSKHYRRLLIEDFMLLQPTNSVLCFMSNKHPLMKSSTWKTQLEEVMKKKPYEPLKLKGTYYFGFEMTVASNIYRSHISEGIFTKKELSSNCTKRGGHGLTMELSNYYQQLITFDNFMNNGYSFKLQTILGMIKMMTIARYR